MWKSMGKEGGKCSSLWGERGRGCGSPEGRGGRVRNGIPSLAETWQEKKTLHNIK